MSLLDKYKAPIVFVITFVLLTLVLNIYEQQENSVNYALEWIINKYIIIQVSLHVVAFLIVILIYIKAKKTVESYMQLFRDNQQTGYKSELHPNTREFEDIETADEQMIILEERSDRLLRIASLIVNIFYILTLVFFFTLNGASIMPDVFLFALFFLMSLGWGWLKQACYNLMMIKEPKFVALNYANNFEEPIFQHLDEAKMLVLYQASYKAYKVAQKFNIIVLVGLSLSMKYFKLGIFPVIIVGIIWVFQTVTYNIEVLRLSKKTSS